VTQPEFGLGLRGDTPLVERIARTGEEAGFSVISVFNDLGYGEPLPVALTAASVTRRVRLGVACYNPYTLPAAEIAGQFLALDAASGGRAFVGLARGAWLDQAGVGQPQPVETIRAAVAAINRLAGRRVPLLIGGWGERIVRLAGEIADELKVGGSANPDLVPLMRRRLGSDRTAIVFGAVTVVDEDRRAARALARERVAMYVDVVGRLDPTLSGVELDLASDAVLDRFAFAGTPADVTRQVRELFDAGLQRVEFGAPFGLDAERGLRLLCDRVLPDSSLTQGR
jgi:5,10-methylenetetrahydromethanopterin reductase